VPRLIHLNGPPGIGKSTLARLYVGDHPGVLNLDIDLVRTLIGGWQDRFAETGRSSGRWRSPWPPRTCVAAGT
jgi:adenylate kinase family enzyme